VPRLYTGRWCDSDHDYARFHPLAEPFGNIFVGSDPSDGMTRETAQSFDVFLNVSDSPSNYFDGLEGQRMHWTPISEMGYWGYAPLYFCKMVLDHHYKKKDRVYVHCHAGAHRGPMMAMCWLLSNGKTLKEAARIIWNGRKSRGGHMEIGQFKLDWKIYRCLPGGFLNSIFGWPRTHTIV